MHRTLGLEFYNSPVHFIVKIPTDDDTPVQVKAMDYRIVQCANFIADMDSGKVIKSRYISETYQLSEHERQWFLRGDVHHVSMEELKSVVQNLYRNW